MLAFNAETVLSLLGDLHQIFPPLVAGPILIMSSIICGMVIGTERRRHEKPAGLRTLTLICLGSTVFTVTSILIANDPAVADRGRIAAQIVPGIGFLGAGVIIRDRGRVRGLTTGATIWAVAAIGVMIGAGYAVAGLMLSFVMLGILTLLRADEPEHEMSEEDN